MHCCLTPPPFSDSALREYWVTPQRSLQLGEDGCAASALLAEEPTPSVTELLSCGG